MRRLGRFTQQCSGEDADLRHVVCRPNEPRMLIRTTYWDGYVMDKHDGVDSKVTVLPACAATRLHFFVQIPSPCLHYCLNVVFKAFSAL